MKIKDAEALIQKAFENKTFAEQWADLGCGSGIFTRALAGCLKEGSKIYAVDREMPSIASTGHIDIECIRADMEHITFSPGELDGILMANSFHYVKDKNRLIENLKSFLKSDGMFLIVEYDTEKANRWVPFPLSFKNLGLLFENNGFGSIKKIGERSSVFGPQKMYASVIKF